MKNIVLTFKQIFVIFFAVFALAACKKTDSNPDNKSGGTKVNPGTGHVVLIANEGQFQAGNSSLSVYSTDDKTIENKAFENKNNQSLGDVFQSITLANNKIYMLINNSGKIVVANQSDLSYQATINGFTSPRYMNAVSNNKAYVSDLFDSKLSVVDLSSNQISKHINLNGGQAEKMVLYKDNLYTGSGNGSYIYIINTNTDAISDSIKINPNSTEMCLDDKNNLWVVSNGDTTSNKPPMIQEVDLQSKSVLSSYSFPVIQWTYPNNLQYDKNNDLIYYLYQGEVYKLKSGQTNLSSNPVIKLANASFYGMAVDPMNSDIYVTDPVDYVQKGWVFRYNSNYSKIDSVRAGITPSHFAFMTH